MSYKVSIIIPVYNVEKYIGKCMDSIVNQSYHNLEITPIDDGATDNCGAILDEYAARDSRVKVIHQENEGRIICRRNAILQSTSDFILLIDGDDWLELDAIELLVKKQIETNADITIGDYQCVFGDGRVVPSSFEKKAQILDRDAYIKKQMSQQLSGSLCIKLYKRTLFKDDFLSFDRKLEAAEDHIGNVQTYHGIKIVATEPKAIYNYYMRSDSICHTFSPTIEHYISLFQTAKREMGEELAAEYKTYHDAFFIRIVIDIIYHRLRRYSETYVGTQAYDYVKSLVENDKGIMKLIPWKPRWKLRLMLHPCLLHFITKLYLLLAERKWRHYTPIGDKYEIIK